MIVTAILAASICVLMVHPAGDSSRRAASMYLILDAACIWGAHWPAGYILLADDGKKKGGKVEDCDKDPDDASCPPPVCPGDGDKDDPNHPNKDDCKKKKSDDDHGKHGK